MKPLSQYFKNILPAVNLHCLSKQFSFFSVSSILLLIPSTLTMAQTDIQLSNLIFDPVPIKVEILEDTNGDKTLAITELTRIKAPKTSSSVIVPPPFALQNIRPSDTKDIEQYKQMILDLEFEGGPYNQSLSEQLLALGSVYQAEGEHNLAIEIFNQAIHINRVNDGLFTLQQTPIIEKIIQSHLARGDLKEANAQHEYLFYLQNKAYQPTDPELLPALTAYAEWNIFAYSLNHDAQLSLNRTPLPEDQFIVNRLVNAQNIYSSIIQILLNNYGFDDPRLLVMEKNLALTNYFFASMINVGRNPFDNTISGGGPSQATFTDASMISSSYRKGQQALERRVSYMRSMQNQPPLEVAKALVELGDWHLIFNKRKAALAAYAAAHQELADTDISDASIETLLHPDMAISIPTFIPGRFSKEARNIPENAPLNYQGFIDVEYTINRYGSPSNIQVLNRESSRMNIESILIREIRRSRFRPRLVEGQPIEKDLSQQRYYYAY